MHPARAKTEDRFVQQFSCSQFPFDSSRVRLDSIVTRSRTSHQVDVATDDVSGNWLFRSEFGWRACGNSSSTGWVSRSSAVFTSAPITGESLERRTTEKTISVRGTCDVTSFRRLGRCSTLVRQNFDASAVLRLNRQSSSSLNIQERRLVSFDISIIFILKAEIRLLVSFIYLLARNGSDFFKFNTRMLLSKIFPSSIFFNPLLESI